MKSFNFITVVWGKITKENNNKKQTKMHLKLLLTAERFLAPFQICTLTDRKKLFLPEGMFY